MPPEADVVEQLTPPVGGPVDPTIGVETPEADAVEQAQDDAAAATTTPTEIPDGAPEADALEQSAVVEGDEDYRD